MGDASEPLFRRVQDLNDVELAFLCCLVAGEHCIIRADADRLDAVAEELFEVATTTFGLTCAISDSSPETTLEEFGNGLLLETAKEHDYINAQPIRRSKAGYGARLLRGDSRNKVKAASHSIANVTIVKNLHQANDRVQIQALELIRHKRIFSRAEFNSTPKIFLFIALLPTDSSARLIPLLNDHVFISHTHEEDLDYHPGDDISIDSTVSVIRSPPASPGIQSRASKPSHQGPIFTKEDIEVLVKRKSAVKLSPEIRGYLHDVVVFMRMNRAVYGGVSALATRHLLELSHVLAPLHELDYIPPSLVALATRKVFLHRIVLTRPEDEKSLQWGSDVRAVAALLEGMTVEDVIEDVLQTVESPL